MNKSELLEIASLSDLKKYEKSKEYKTILEFCEIKQDSIKQEILNSYIEDSIDRTEVYDFHDKQYVYLEFLKQILDKIKDKSKGAKALQKEIQHDIKITEIGIGTRATNEFGIPYSSSKLTAMDMKRCEAGNYRTFYTILNGLITLLEDPKASKDNEIY